MKRANFELLIGDKILICNVRTLIRGLRYGRRSLNFISHIPTTVLDEIQKCSYDFLRASARVASESVRMQQSNACVNKQFRSLRQRVVDIFPTTVCGRVFETAKVLSVRRVREFWSTLEIAEGRGEGAGGVHACNEGI